MAEQTGPRSRATELALEKAYAAKGPEANRELYASWAKTYESGFVVDSGYVYHQEVVKVFCDGFSDPGQPVLDVGCGTGVVGDELAKLGMSVIDGIDMMKLSQRLWDEKIENSCPQIHGVSYLRASVHFFNTCDEVDRLIATVKDILANRRDLVAA